MSDTHSIAIILALSKMLLAGLGAQAPTPLTVERLEVPTHAPSRLPHLWTDSDQRLGLSWVEEREAKAGGSESTLWRTQLDASGWSAPAEVARGMRWFVNWADFPAVVSLSSKHLLAHFLEKSGEGAYDYHVRFVRSVDGGKTWSDPIRLHDDSGPGEHGFVSIIPLSAQSAAAVWLDGRNAAGHGESMGGGATALYARSISPAGDLGPEAVIDGRVCDCCPTSGLRAPDGALVVAYRDRSSEEVRDITVVRWKEGRIVDSPWTSGDRWKIAGCPVDGPALDIAGDRIGLAWFTLGADERSRVLCAFSKDGGRSFSPPLELSGARAHGRVDAMFDAEGRFVVTWLEFDGERTQWHAARLATDERSFERGPIVEASGGRESGHARLARDRESVVFAWTEAGEKPRVAMSRLRWK